MWSLTDTYDLNCTPIRHAPVGQVHGKHVKLYPVVGERLERNEVFPAIDQNKIDLVVLGYQGVTGIRWFLLGSMNEEVLHHAPCSVLMVRNTLGGPHSKQSKSIKIFLAADDSSDSKSAVELVRFLTFPPKPSISLLHVLEPRPDPKIYVGPNMAIPHLSELLEMEEQIWKSREQEGGKLFKIL